jgi:fatty acid desaturase
VVIVSCPLIGIPALGGAFIGASLIGFWLAYLILFQHEGAHYNLARSKTVSDWICDCLISWIIGTSVSQYRLIHFRHHRALGTTFDSEHTYFFPLNFWFIIKSITGIRALEVLVHRQKIHVHETQNTQATPCRPALGMRHVGFFVLF